MASRIQCDVHGLEILMHQVGDRALRGIYGVMLEEGKEMQKLAIAYAPVDDEYLENAIKCEPVTGERDALGRFVRGHVSVFVDPNATGDRGRSVAMYGWMQHEWLQPFGHGSWELGKKSEIKDGNRGIVGGKFMERAQEKRRHQLYKKAFEIARRAVK